MNRTSITSSIGSNNKRYVSKTNTLVDIVFTRGWRDTTVVTMGEKLPFKSIIEQILRSRRWGSNLPKEGGYLKFRCVITECNIIVNVKSFVEVNEDNSNPYVRAWRNINTPVNHFPVNSPMVYGSWSDSRNIWKSNLGVLLGSSTYHTKDKTFTN